MDINRKIIKYTQKLKNTTSKSKAEYYQKKLYQYHKINQKNNMVKYKEMFGK